MKKIEFSSSSVARRTRRRVLDVLLAQSGDRAITEHLTLDDLATQDATKPAVAPKTATPSTTASTAPNIALAALAALGDDSAFESGMDDMFDFGGGDSQGAVAVSQARDVTDLSADFIPDYAVGDDLNRTETELRARVLFLELTVRWRLTPDGMTLEDLATAYARDLTAVFRYLDDAQRKNRKPGRPREYRLDETDTARLIAYTTLVARLDSSRKPNGAGRGSAQLATYCDDENDVARYGLWLAETDYDRKSNPSPLDSLVLRIAPYLARRGGIETTRSVLCDLCEVIELERSPFLGAFENGIVDLRDKSVRPFSPDLVFTHKGHRYLADAVSPTVQTDRGVDWNLDNWLAELCERDELQLPEETAAKRQTLGEILAKSAFPNIPTSKAVLLYDTIGGTGKGTFVGLIRGVAGPESVFNRNFARLCTRFGWQGLGTRTVIASDENPVNSFETAPDNFKSAVTGNILSIEGKGLPIQEQIFTGLVIMCMNGMPRVADTSDSFLRRLLFRQFHHRYYDPDSGDDRSVADRIIPSTEVLDYATKLAVDSAHDWYERGTLGTWTECREDRALLQSFAELNDPVRAYAADLNECNIDGISTDIAFRAFQEWYIDSFGEGRSPMGKRRFTEQMRSVCGALGWEDWTARKWTSTGDDAVRIADKNDSVAVRCGMKNTAGSNVHFLVCEPGRITRGFRRAARRDTPSAARVTVMP